MTLVFSRSAFRQLASLEKVTQRRIISKLEFYLAQKHPLDFAEPLVGSRFGQWRFRIGDYRVLCDVKGDSFIVLAVGHRKDIYR